MARKKRKRRRGWIIFIILAVIAVAVGLSIKNRLADKKNNGLKMPDIKTAMVERGDVEIVLREIGTIEPAVNVEVKSNLAGKLTDIFVREGDKVKSGQRLAIVEPELNQARTLTQIRSALRRAEIELREARNDYEKKQQLLKEGYASSDEVRLAKVRLEEARNAYKSARQDYDIVEASGIPMDSSGSVGERMNIESPIAGVVLRVNVEKGEMVTSASSFNAGTVLCEVADLDVMLIRASINEVDIGKVEKGQKVKIKVDAFPRETLWGEVSYISPAAEQASGMQGQIKVFKVEVTIDEVTVKLRSGMTANIDIMGDKREDVLIVPVEAVFQKGDEDIVYVKKPGPAGSSDAGGGGPASGKPDDEEAPAKSGGDVESKEGEDGAAGDQELWKKPFEEREVEVGLVDLKHAEIIEGVEEGDEVAVENPILSEEDRRRMHVRFD